MMARVNMRTIAVVALCACGSVLVDAQPAGELPRRAWFGVALAPHDRGVAITSVVDGSTAAVEGMRAGDVITAIDDVPMRAPADVVRAVTRHVSGDTMRLERLRGDERDRRTVALRPFPRETIPGAVLDYASVTLDDGTRLRTIVSVPDAPARRFPALLLLQGGGCGSVDVPMAPAVGPAGLMRTIATQSFVTMRVELSGVGDSQGPPCDTIGYRQELAGYRAALAALKRHPRVDPDRIVLLGLSLGGVFAPTLAREQPVRGIIVYGTLATPPSPYPGRSEQFFREFASVDVAADWAAIDARVLVLAGEFDENTTSAEHALRIAAIVNGRHSGAAVRREFEGLDHCWTRHVSMEESRGHCGTGAATMEVDNAILKFLGSIR